MDTNSGSIWKIILDIDAPQPREHELRMQTYKTMKMDVRLALLKPSRSGAETHRADIGHPASCSCLDLCSRGPRDEFEDR